MITTTVDDLKLLRAARMNRVMNKLKSVSVSVMQSVLAMCLYFLHCFSKMIIYKHMCNAIYKIVF